MKKTRFWMALLVGLPSLAWAEPLRLTIFHTNDMHSHVEPVRTRGRELGGFARISTLLKSMRVGEGHQITLDAGDIFQGSAFYELYKGEVEVELLNKLGYDIATIGNHEFDDGPVNLARQLKRARYQVISCNLNTSSFPELSACYTASAVREFGGQKVGFVGAITPDLEEICNRLDGVTVKRENGDWVPPVRAEVERLQAQGIDKIVLLTHCGVNFDRELAAGVPAIDVIIGGHSHTRLDKPITVSHPDGQHTLIVQADCYSRCVGRFEVEFDSQGRVDIPKSHYQLLDVTDQLALDPEVVAYLEEMAKPLAASRAPLGCEAVGHFEDDFSDLFWDSKLGNVITDAFVEGAREHGASIALHNRGGIRSRIEEGPLNRGQLEAVLPFDNKLVITEVSGTQLKKVLEHSLASAPRRRFFDVHGLQIGYKPSAPEGQKLTFVRVQSPQGQWQPLEEQQKYRVALNDYSFGGGEGYDFGQSPVVKATGRRLSEFFIDYARAHKQLQAQAGARIAPLQPSALFQGRILPASALGPGASLTILEGSGPGVTSWKGIPVPLAQARVVSQLSGPGPWKVPASRKWTALVGESGNQRKLWLLPP